MSEEKLHMELEKKLEQSAKAFKKAMKGLGTDENVIIKETCALTNVERQLLKTKYMDMYGVDLISSLNSEIGGLFLKTVLALFQTPDEYEAHILRDAIQGLGTDEKKVIEILCTKNAEDIVLLKKGYRKAFKRDLASDMKSEEGGNLGKLFRRLVNPGRAVNHGYDIEFIQNEADALYKSGEKRIGTNESEFVRIFASRSYAELHSIFAVYEDKYKKDIEHVIRREMSGDLCTALITITRCVRNPAGYYAEAIYRTIDGAGTREQDLLEILVRRTHIDMALIKKEYTRLYKKNMVEEIGKDVSGDFKKILIALIGSV